MGRKIILLSDGTGNSSAKIWRTNVWRTFQALDLTTSEQVAYYDDGVGTSSFKPFALLGGAFGFGLKRNVLNLYKFACRNCRSADDEIFGFGFSRGAFTIRVVIGLILDQGLIDGRNIDDDELGRLAQRAYRAYHRAHFHTNWGHIFIALRQQISPQKPVDTDHLRVGNLPPPRIRFLGLWDTVAAYGLPIDEMTRGFSQWIWPLEAPNHTLNRAVERACHALALDDERTTFHPVLWNERGELDATPTNGDCYTSQERISQVWFTGMHANVGGGYPDDSLAHIPLYWIMEEARACGLTFKQPPTAEPDMIAQIKSSQDKDGRIYNSRTGFGSYYRYGPRKISELCQQRFSRSDEVYVPYPKIHASVFERIKNNAHVYAPIGLPERYQVVTHEVQGDKMQFKISPVERSPYENLDEAKARANFQTTTIGNLVALRAFLYILTVIVTATFLLSPISGVPHPVSEMTSPFRWFSDIIRLVGTVLPGFADRWVNGYAQSPGTTLLFIAALAGLTLSSTRVATKISNRMSTAWKGRLLSSPEGLKDPEQDLGFRFRSRILGPGIRFWKFWLAPALSALLLVYAGVATGSHLLYNVQDIAGLTCKPTSSPKDLDKNGAVVRFRASELCHATGLRLKAGRSYAIRVNPDESLLKEYKDAQVRPASCDANSSPILENGSLKTDERGYTTFPSDDDQHFGALQFLKDFFLLPFRRILDRAWFQVVVRYGSVGGEESYLDPDKYDRRRPIEARIRPPFDAELFIFLNDAAFAIPGLHDIFYRDNRGCVTVLVRP